MPPDFSQIGPFLFAALIVFAIYRRLRRSFGRQVLRPGRMIFRIVLITAVGCALLPMALRSSQYLWAELAGAALGIGLGLWGAERTRFVMHGGRLHYVPHTYTGIAVSLLFLGRLAFRAVQVYAGVQVPHAADSGGAYVTDAPDPSLAFAPTSMVRSPLTVGIFFVLAGYYLWYYGSVLWKSKHLKAEDIEATSPAAAP
jgi:hypothetical protein